MKVTVIIDLCTKDFKEHLELSTREMTYKQVRDGIISYAERKRNAFSNDLKAMDVDEVEEGNKGGYKDYPKGGSRGSFNDLKGVGKGDYSKGGSKGDGQGKGGKGSGFNRYCHWCGEWGLSQSRCRQKDDYMENQRKNGKGNSKGGYEQIAHNVEENKNQLDNLVKSVGYRCLCSLEHLGGQHRAREERPE